MTPHQTFKADVYENPETCELCGGEVKIGDYPFCKGDPLKHARPEMKHRPFPTVEDDNLGHRRPDGKWEPFRPTSQADRKRRMKELKLDYHGRRRGEKGCEV